MNYKIISFYFDGAREDRFYYSCHLRMKKALSDHGLDFQIIEPRLSTTQYEDITKYKAEYIYQSMLKFKCPVLWLDIDSELHFDQLHSHITGGLDQLLLQFKDNYDFVALKDYGISSSCCNPEFHAHFLYFNYNTLSLQMVRQWLYNCKHSAATSGDHTNLLKTYKKTIKEGFTRTKIIQINNTGRFITPVISHTQRPRTIPAGYWITRFNV